MVRAPLSLCLVIKNEEIYLRAALESAAALASEVLIADSGSSDRSIEIAKAFQKSSDIPTHLFNYEWQDDFSAARNWLAEKATQPWVLFLDGDEVVEPSDLPLIQKTLESTSTDCFSFKQKNYTNKLGTELAHEVQPPYPTAIRNFENAPLYAFENWMERLYRRDKGLSYEGVIHESLLPACSRLGLRHERLPVTLHHFGRLKPQTRDKYVYYLQLARKKLADQPDNAAAWIEMIVNLSELEEFGPAFEISQQATGKFKEEPEIFKAAFQAAMRSDNWVKAEDWIRQFLSFHPKDLYARSQLSTALLYQGKMRETILVTQEVLKEDPRDFVSHLNTAIVFFESKEWKNAARHLAYAREIRPHDNFVRDAMSKIPAEFQIH